MHIFSFSLPSKMWFPLPTSPPSPHFPPYVMDGFRSGHASLLLAQIRNRFHYIFYIHLKKKKNSASFSVRVHSLAGLFVGDVSWLTHFCSWRARDYIIFRCVYVERDIYLSDPQCAQCRLIDSSHSIHFSREIVHDEHRVL